jgi:thymidylate synthase (FAD)
MKIVKPSVELLHHTPNPERVIERCGRACYQSQHKIKTCASCGGATPIEQEGHVICCVDCNGTGTDIASAIAFIEMIKKNGHESVLEHASAGFSIITDRGVTHEIVRHRLASYSQESTRYCNYSKEQFGDELAFILPPDLQGRFEEWEAAMLSAEETYLFLLAHNCAPQIARSVLPNSLKSEICMTANFREWRHFLRLRTSPKAHPQMREIAEMIRAELLRISKVCFDDIP